MLLSYLTSRKYRGVPDPTACNTLHVYRQEETRFMWGSRNGRILFVASLAVTCCATLSASPISGGFTLDGTITVSPTVITWQLNVANPVNKALLSNGTGSFAPFNGTDATLQTLTNPPDTVTSPASTFPLQPFVSFDAAPVGFPTLMINEIFPGFLGTAGCTASPAQIGQVCTPPVPPPNVSPFSFVNQPGAGGTIASAAVFNFAGLTSDGLETWTGSFATSFNVPFQTVLAQLAATGSVQRAFEGTFTLAPVTGVPEPGPMALMGLGLGLVALSAGLRKPLKRR
jgi:hypothetical protein